MYLGGSGVKQSSDAGIAETTTSRISFKFREKGSILPLHLVVGKSGMTSDVTLSELKSM